MRKVVSVVFCDVTGSTALGERLDPESLRQVMGRYFDSMRGVLERHGGSVEKFIGDAVMAVFGVPVLHEDDALRAVRAAAEMRDELERLNVDLAQGWGIRIQARIGVNTGEVVVGDPTAGQTLVVGDAVNVAARLEQAARPDEILIGASTERLVRDAVVTEAVEPLALKGKAEAVEAHRLLQVRPEAPGFTRRLDSPLVGREGERTLLWQAYERAARDRTCHLFTILGSAGVGKSRLAAELTAVCMSRATVASGRCLPYGEGITYRPVAEAIREVAGVAETDPLDSTLRRLEDLLAGEPDGALVARRLSPLLGAVDGSGEAEETSWAVRRLFEAVARDRPAVVIFDDIHWGEPTFLDLVEYLADWSRDTPMLLICLARPELLDARPTWGGGKLNATTIQLEPLTEEESATLISNLVGRAELAKEIQTRITAAAEGNPLFVEQLLAMLMDDGSLRREDGRWLPTRDLTRLRVPPTIQALLSARLDRLRPEERAVLECASVEGKVFHRGAIVDLSAPELDVPGHIQTLVRKELVRPGRTEFPGEDAFAFRHLLIRDAAYQGMAKETRAELHARFADWLLGTAAAGTTEYQDIAGYHLEQAHRYRRELGPLDERARDLAERSARLLRASGRRALDRGDVPAAVNLLERAAALLPEEHGDRLSLLVDLTQALIEKGDFARAIPRAESVIEAASQRGDRRSEWLARLQLAELRLNTDPGGAAGDQAGETADRAIELFGHSDEHDVLARAWHIRGLVGWIEARSAGTEEALERAVEYARRAGDRRQETEDLSLLVMTAAWGPTPVVDGIRRARDIMERAAGHPKVEAMALATQGHLEAMMGRFDDAREHVRQGREILRQRGMEMLYAATSHAAGFVEMTAGDPATAERTMRDGFDILERLGETAYLSTSAAYIAEALCQQGRYEDAEVFTRISEESADPHDLASQIFWRIARAKVLVRRNLLKEAEKLARDAVLLSEDSDFLDTRIEAVVTLAEVLEATGRSAEVEPRLQEARTWARRKESPVFERRVDDWLGRLRGS